MTANSRFFIIRADGSTLTVKGDQLGLMRQGGFIGPDDKVIPVSGEPIVAPDRPQLQAESRPKPTPNTASPFGKFTPAVDDIDTAPIEYKGSQSRFSDLDDIEIDQAFSTALSRSLYQLEAETAKDAITTSNDSIIPGLGAKGEKSYTLRLADGRVLGPFELDAIEAKISDRSVDASTEISDFGSEKFTRLVERPEFLISYKRLTIAKPEARDRILQLSDAGVSGLVLEVSHQLKTGWLYLELDDETYLVSIAIGKLLSVHALKEDEEDLEKMLKSVFGADRGQAWFEEDLLAASDSVRNLESSVALCRRLTSQKGGFAQARLLHALGDQTRLLQLRPPGAWHLNQDELTDLEAQVIKDASLSQSIHAALHQFVENHISYEEAVHALFFCQIAGLTSFLSEQESQDINALYTQLASDSFIELLPISLESSDADIVRELAALKSRVMAATKPLSIRDPLRQKMRERVNAIYDMLLDPAERYAYFMARARGEEGGDNTQLRDALKKEFLERRISQLFEKGAYADALSSAEKYYKLAPNEADASAKYLYSKFFSVATHHEQLKIIGEMVENLKTNGPNIEILLVLASANLEMRDFGDARKYLKKARKLSPGDARVATLLGHYEAISAAESEVRGSGPVKIASIVWVTVVTLALTAALWVLAIDLELGKNETYTDAYDSFVFIRATALIIATLLGYFVLHQKGLLAFLARFKMKLSLLWVFGCLLLGSILGAALSHFSVIDEEMSVGAFFLLAFSAIVARVYFSGFMAFDLFNSISRRWVAIIWVSILNILYYGSFDEVVRASSFSEIALRLTVLFFGLSVPMAFIQSATKSVVAPMIFQVFFVISAKLISLFGGGIPNWFGM